MLSGTSALSDAELIAILIRTGSPSENAVDLAKRLLRFCDNKLNLLAEKSIEELQSVKGIGSAKAITLLAAFELGHRIRSEKVQRSKCINNAEDVLLFMQDKIAYLKHEEFWTIYLDSSNQILGSQQIGKGGISQTTVDVRIILQHAILLSSSRIIVCHNHPSGRLKPSPQDRSLTSQIKNAANLLNISLLDHVIVYKNTFYSFEEENNL